MNDTATPLLFRYWGKTQGDDDHPLVYHALDVAAGGYGISAEHPGYAFTSGQVEALAGLISVARPLVGRPLSGPSESRAESFLPPIFS